MQCVSHSDTLQMVRVFKNKWFSHWARKEGISDAVLLSAAKEVTEGKVEAELGGCLLKKRLPRAGTGKRGGYRVIVGYKRPDAERIVFLYAFAKNDKSSISSREEAALSLAAESFISTSDKQVHELLLLGSIREVQCHEE